VNALSVSNLRVAYDHIPAVHDVSLSVGPGEVLALLGPNGAGKTSLVEAIAGLLRKSSGRVWFFGEDITRLDASAVARRGLALVPQWRELFPRFSVEETLAAGVNAAKNRPQRPFDEIYALFPRLAERRKQLAGALSGGEQQMLAIARALVANPKMLLLDEPSAGLAVGIVKDLIQIIRRISDQGVPLLLVEQNMEIAKAIAPRGAIIGAGRVVWEGTMAAALEGDAAAHAYFGH
jgi:branched-chain amino acid transport system ATP-binding protein